MSAHLRLMTDADIPAGMRLKDLAGWNQTASDWERFLRASPAGCFVAESGGRVRGTAATIVYEGRFAWIGMVLGALDIAVESTRSFLLIYILINISCFAYYVRFRRGEFNVLTHLIVPILGIALFVPAFLTAAGVTVK